MQKQNPESRQDAISLLVVNHKLMQRMAKAGAAMTDPVVANHELMTKAYSKPIAHAWLEKKIVCPTNATAIQSKNALHAKLGLIKQRQVERASEVDKAHTGRFKAQ